MASKTKKICLWTLGTSTSIFLILIIGIWIGFQFISERALRMAAPGSSIEQARITPAGSFFENIRINVGGTDITIGRIEAYATLDDILDKRLTKLVIDNVMVSLPASNDTEKESPSAGFALPAPLDLHVREIVFRNVRTFVPFAEGVPVVFSGNLVDRGEEYQLSGDYQATGESLKAAGQITVKAVKATGALSVHTDIAEGRLDMPEPPLALRRGAGWLAFDLTPEALAGKLWPTINAQLSAGSLKLYDLPLQGLTLTAAITPEKSEVLVQAQGMDDSGELTGEIRLDRSAPDTDKLAATLEAKLKNLDALGVNDLKGRGQAHIKISAAKPRNAGWLEWQDVSGGLDLAAQNLSLPGLMRGVEAAATFSIAHDPVAQKTVLQAADKPVTVKGVFLPLDTKPLSLHIPAQKNKPATISWQAAEKQLALQFGGLDTITPHAAIKGLAVELTAGFAGEQPDLRATLTAVEIAHTQKPPAFVPVRLSADVKTAAAGKGLFNFKADLTEKNGLLTVNIAGQHDLPAQKGRLDLSMPQTTLRTGVYSLKDIFPLSATYVQDVTGTIGMTAAFGWQKGKNAWTTTSKGEIFLRDVTGNVEGNIINNVSGVVKFDSLLPLTMKEQRLAVGSVNVGLPLSAGLVVASLDAQNRFTLHEAEWTLAEGKITSSPFTVKLDNLSADNITLTAKDLQLSSLFKIAPMDGLTADGTVDGILPLRIDNGEVTIENGVLESKGSGNIRYSPQDMPAFLRDNTQKQMVDLQVALKAFEFESLKLTLDGTLGKNQKIGISVKGNNPEFYNGYPVSLNLNVEGPLENILRYSPGSSQIPDSIRKQLEEYEKNNAKK
ncbi:MAG: YdbH domain-containing protein [Alphaproteobacteria bacterium]|nr:YdbH domain-containing protein [Alphaproteobacteria bacterium]